MFKFKFKFESDVGVLIGDRSLTAEEAVRCFKDTSYLPAVVAGRLVNACALSTTSNKILSHRERAPRPGKATITTTTCPGKATATTTTTTSSKTRT